MPMRTRLNPPTSPPFTVEIEPPDTCLSSIRLDGGGFAPHLGLRATRSRCQNLPFDVIVEILAAFIVTVLVGRCAAL